MSRAALCEEPPAVVAAGSRVLYLLVMTSSTTPYSTARNYDIVQADGVDERGIDVAFLFDPSLFAAPANERFQHVVMRRTGTREIFQVNFRTVLLISGKQRTGHPAIRPSGVTVVLGPPYL